MTTEYLELCSDNKKRIEELEQFKARWGDCGWHHSSVGSPKCEKGNPCPDCQYEIDEVSNYIQGIKEGDKNAQKDNNEIIFALCNKIGKLHLEIAHLSQQEIKPQNSVQDRNLHSDQQSSTRVSLAANGGDKPADSYLKELPDLLMTSRKMGVADEREALKELIIEWLRDWEEHHTLSRNIVDRFKESKIMERLNADR